MWSQASEFTSGIWKKRPFCRLPRCVWQVTSVVTNSAKCLPTSTSVSGCPNMTSQQNTSSCEELNFFHCVSFSLDSSGHCFQLAFDLKIVTFIEFIKYHHWIHQISYCWLWWCSSLVSSCLQLWNCHWRCNSLIFEICFNPWRFACQAYYQASFRVRKVNFGSVR